MKKAGIILLALILIFGAFMTLTACEGSDSLKLPGSAWEKVNFAFNGVEQSFSKGGSKNAAPTGGSKIYGVSMSKDEALDAIRGIYVDTDRETWNEQEQLDYDQPPMAQFRYMKAVFESIGEDYSFGTKYHDVVSGYIYFDPETGLRSPKTEEYKYPYSIDFAMAISIDDKDDIYCEVSFLIDITKSSGSIQTKWYVSFVIDYDMTQTTPNYTMLMLTDNQEGDLSYRHVQGYEYDYVDVKDNSIVEWRKFFMECENPIVIDEAHPDFASYENAGLQYNADTCKWYAGNTYRKVKQMNAVKMQTIARAFVDGLGMNTTEINAEEFFNKSSEQSEAISAYYTAISSMKGEELIYDLVCVKEDHELGEDPERSWPSQFLERAGIGSLVPRFSSQNSLSYSVRYDNQGGETAEVTITGATASDFEAYIRVLAEAGFESQPTEEGYALSIKDLNDQMLMIAVNKDLNAIFIGLFDKNDNGGGNNGNTKSIDIIYSMPFTYEFQSYTTTDIPAKDVAAYVEEISGGMVQANDIAGSVEGNSKHYEIEVPLRGDSVKAANDAKEYYLNVIGNMPEFVKGAPVKWTTVGTNHVDVVIVVDDDVSTGRALLNIYVFVFKENSVRAIAEAAQQQINEGGNGGEGGNGSGSDEGGSGSGNGEGEGGVSNLTRIYAWNIDASGKKEIYREFNWPSDQRFPVWNLGDNEWLIYTDEACTQIADFDKGEAVTPGEAHFYCKDRDNVDYIGVTYIRYRIDKKKREGFWDKKTVVHRKGQYVDIYDDNHGLGNNLQIYASYNAKEESKSGYLDPDHGDRSTFFAYTENVTLYAFATESNVTCYDVYSGGEYRFTQARDFLAAQAENEEFHSENDNFRADVVETNVENTTTIHVTNIKHSYTYNVAYCYNGHVVYVETWFFEDPYAWAVVLNDYFYNSPALSAHTSYSADDEVYGTLVHYFTSDVTVYCPYEP